MQENKDKKSNESILLENIDRKLTVFLAIALRINGDILTEEHPQQKKAALIGFLHDSSLTNKEIAILLNMAENKVRAGVSYYNKNIVLKPKKKILKNKN